MSQTKEVRYTARSITPPANRNGTSKSPPATRRSPSRSPRPRSPKRRSMSRSEDDRNPGNNLYVTGLSTRVTEDDLEKFFNKEGKVKHCHVVQDPRTKESRGFAFVTMETVDDARRCIKYLHRTVLEGRLVTVEKALLSSTMVVAKGCAADTMVLITIPQSSSSLRVVYTSRTDTAYPLHQHELLCIALITDHGVTLRFPSLPLPPPLPRQHCPSDLEGSALSTSTEDTWCILLPCHVITNCQST
ncbi:hypothetical protein PR202_gb03402 [Eleusine coracana subsp. coracana]|uniref:RRM domain-containing protein n=1 Tax=Eleusine coracana subsp. coracana TaxID=191504 RepID=A0AAV5E129_ELECO|nr:hypothetical protein PR202_gb03402 [Eleusine coracana subsp. coracana]